MGDVFQYPALCPEVLSMQYISNMAQLSHLMGSW